MVITIDNNHNKTRSDDPPSYGVGGRIYGRRGEQLQSIDDNSWIRKQRQKSGGRPPINRKYSNDPRYSSGHYIPSTGVEDSRYYEEDSLTASEYSSSNYNHVRQYYDHDTGGRGERWNGQPREEVSHGYNRQLQSDIHITERRDDQYDDQLREYHANQYNVTIRTDGLSDRSFPMGRGTTRQLGPIKSTGMEQRQRVLNPSRIERRDEYTKYNGHHDFDERPTSPIVAVDHINGSIHNFSKDYAGGEQDGEVGYNVSTIEGPSMPNNGMPPPDDHFRRKPRSDMSWSSDTVSDIEKNNWRMEYDGAKPSSDLPRGYLRRKDGVVLSAASSNGSISNVSERYIDPKSAAQSVVDDMKSQGYEYSEMGGINFSYTSSVSDIDRYDRNKPIGPKYTATKKQNTSSNPNSNGTMKIHPIQPAHSIRSKEIEQLNEQHGSAMSLVKSFEELVTTNSPDWSQPVHVMKQRMRDQKPPTGRAKVNGVVHGGQYDPILSNRSLCSKDASSLGGSVFRAKAAATPPPINRAGRSGLGSVPTISRGSHKSNGNQNQHRAIAMHAASNLPAASAVTTTASVADAKEFDASRIAEDTFSKNTHHEESTISTKEHHQQSIPFLPSQPGRSGITNRAIVDGEDQRSYGEENEEYVSSRNKGASKSVGFSGEMPPPTKAGGRVPEMIARLPATPTVSDISSMPRSGQSGVTTIPFEGTAIDKMGRFMEQMVLTCRLAVFHPN